MDLYYGGTEVSQWRTLLANDGIERVSLSYIGLRRRTKFVRPWSIGDKYPANQKIFLDSGAYTANKDSDKFTVAELKDISAAYQAFVASNLEYVEFVSEFDATVLGRDWIEAMREDFYEDLDDKFLPIWHEQYGLDDLERLCQRYKRVGVGATVVGGRDLTPTLNSLVNRYGTMLHGVNVSKPDEMAAIKWASISTISWISPAQFGDTIIWTGKELKRYPKKYKDQARTRHRTLIDQAGFDSTKIEDDDTTEVVRLSVWSWEQLVEDINRRKVVTRVAETADPEIAETEGGVVDTVPSETRKTVATVTERDASEIVPLPVLGIYTEQESYLDEQGAEQLRDLHLVEVRSKSQRVCDSCFLSSKCPAFKPQTNCAYDIPITIRTKPQMLALQNAIVEMQAQRVFFMKMIEDQEGGYVDPNLSNEINRLQKLMKTKHDMEQETFSVKFEASAPARSGMISRLFGREAAEQASAVPAITADVVIAERLDIIDADVLYDH